MRGWLLNGGEITALLAAAGALAFLAGENALRRRARAALGLVIHVNGTRGKSETTRLLAAVLRASGRRTLARTTGTEPRLILEDGSERRWRRWGAANVREQRNLLLAAWRRRDHALVAECMAVSPDAQRASTAFLEPSVLVVTNSRPDHAYDLGTPEEALAVFAEGVPAGGLVLTADPGCLPELERVAAERGARCLLAPPRPGPPGCQPENVGIALALAGELGIPEDRAMAGLRACPADPGAFAIRRLVRPGGGVVTVVDALAANDPVSTEQLFGRYPCGPGEGPRLLLLANRADRPDRALGFARWAAERRERWAGVLLAGPTVPGVRRILAPAWPGRVRRLRRVADLVREPDGTVVFAAGNWQGLGPALAERSR